jgi:hypothetical protein
MNPFDDLIGQKILNIHRLDYQVDYEFYSPNAIILTIDGRDEFLILSATNDGSFVDIRMTTDEEIEADYGLEFTEHILNALKKGDELNSFIGEKILSIRVAEYILPEIKGADFIINQGKLAGIELKTEGHKLLFQNNYGGCCDIDDEFVELSKQDKCRWK